MIIAAPSVTRLLCNLPFGLLCDKIGRKPLMWLGTAITSVGMVGQV
jgi:MFS family permease